MDHPEFTKANANLYYANLSRVAENNRLAIRIGKYQPKRTTFIDWVKRWFKAGQPLQPQAEQTSSLRNI